jgi:hypothetical protein
MDRTERRRRQGEEDFAEISALRRDLLTRVPITSAQITMCENYLVRNRRTNPIDLAEIIYRVLFVQSLLYEEAADDPDLKHEILCSIREQYRDFMSLPEWGRELIIALGHDLGSRLGCDHPYEAWEDLLAKEEKELAHG